MNFELLKLAVFSLVDAVANKNQNDVSHRQNGGWMRQTHATHISQSLVTAIQHHQHNK